jgi:hypothetical protein
MEAYTKLVMILELEQLIMTHSKISQLKVQYFHFTASISIFGYLRWENSQSECPYSDR